MNLTILLVRMKNKDEAAIVKFFKRKHELKYKREFQFMINDDNFDILIYTIVPGLESSLF